MVKGQAQATSRKPGEEMEPNVFAPVAVTKYSERSGLNCRNVLCHSLEAKDQGATQLSP